MRADRTIASIGRLDEGIVDGDLELELRQQPHHVLLGAVDLGEALLPAAAADVADGHQVDVALGQGLLDLFEFLRAG